MTSPIDIGPGLEPDAWQMLLAARHVAQQHAYLASRLPGYPLPELAYSLLASYPIWVSVGLTFVVSLAGFYSFFRILGKLGVRDRLLTTLAFAFTPVVLINCISTMDYMWALSFALGSLLFGFRKQPTLSGVFLGLAIASRITSVLFAIPVLYLLSQIEQFQKNKIREYVVFLLPAGLVALVFYLLVLATYGFHFLTHSAPATVRIASLAKLLSIDTFGVMGVSGIIISLIVHFVTREVEPEKEHPTIRTWKIVCYTTIILFGMLFVFLPLEAGYLIPLIPFALLLARLSLHPAAFRILAVGLIVSPFVLGLDATDRPWSPAPTSWSVNLNAAGRSMTLDILNGPVVLDIRKRRSQIDYAQSVLRWAHSQRDSSTLIAGVWMPTLMYMANALPTGHGEEQFKAAKVRIVGLADTEVVAEIHRTGRPVYFLTGQDQYEKSVYGFDVASFNAKECKP